MSNNVGNVRNSSGDGGGDGHPTGVHGSRMSSPPPPNILSPLKVDQSSSSHRSDGRKDAKRTVKTIKFADDTDSKKPEMTPAGDDDQLIQKQEASAEKDRGNDHFKAGRYDQAIACYT